MNPVRAGLAALLMLAAGGCASNGAPVAPLRAPALTAVARPASVQLVDRLAEQSATAMPDVTGGSVARARERLDDLQVTVVRFGRARRAPVAAQWPVAGEPRPAAGPVVVWIGTPPAPPAARSTPPAAPATTTAAADDLPADLSQLATPDTDAADAPAAPASGRTPGLEKMVPPPHPPRANIRTLPTATAGTSLSGRASWYGPGFTGRPTACGTTFEASQLTLASRELRCGTRVVVTGPVGSVAATVTDWGPAEWTNRRFDLSQATFDAVAALGAGVIDVTVEVR